MKETRDETLTKINDLVELCKDMIRKSSLPSSNGIYLVGKFEVMFAPSLAKYGQRTLDSLIFWKKDRKEQGYVEIGNKQLNVFGRKNNIILSDNLGLTIKEHINQFSNKYPTFEFSWIGELIKEIPRGTLTFVRVNLSGSNFVYYSYDQCSREYKIGNPHRIDLHCLKFPMDLKKVDNILGVSFERMINFDKKEEEILESSGLEELSQEIKSCT